MALVTAVTKKRSSIRTTKIKKMSFADFPAPNGVPGSVTNWIDALRDNGSDGHIQRELWERYFRKLTVVARKHLAPVGRLGVDEEDIALSVLNSFFNKLDEGRFPHLADRDQLWKLLTTIATYKAINAKSRQKAQKRGGGSVGTVSAFGASDLWRELAAVDPGPQEVAEFKELISHLLMRLDPTLRTVAHGKLLGKSDAEIAQELDVSPRTIHRKVTRIRTTWQAEFE